MRPADVLKVLREQPFRPFRIYLSNGQTFDIRHPELVMVGKSALIVGKASMDVPGAIDDYDVISLIHINRIEILPVAAASPTSG